MPSKRTITGLPVNTIITLCYLFGPFSGFVFLLLEKDPLIRFHALQSILTFGTVIAIQWIFAGARIFSPLVSVVGLLAFILWLVLLYRSYKGESVELPYVSKVVKKLLKNA